MISLKFDNLLFKFKEIKRSVGSVRLILVDSQPENYLPDVYLRKVYDENDEVIFRIENFRFIFIKKLPIK